MIRFFKKSVSEPEPRLRIQTETTMATCIDKMHRVLELKRTAELWIFLLALLLLFMLINHVVPGTSDADRTIGLGAVVLVACLGAAVHAYVLTFMTRGLFLPDLSSALAFWMIIALIYGIPFLHALRTLHPS